MSNFAKIAAEQIVDDLEDEDRPHSSALVRALPWLGGAAALMGGAYAANRYLGHGAVQGAVDAVNENLRGAGQATEGLMGRGTKAFAHHLADWTNEKPGGALNAGLIAGGLGATQQAARDTYSALKGGPQSVKARELVDKLEGTRLPGSKVPPSRLSGLLSAPNLDHEAGLAVSQKDINSLGAPQAAGATPHGLQGDNLSRLRQYLKTVNPEGNWTTEQAAQHLRGQAVGGYTPGRLGQLFRRSAVAPTPGLGDPANLTAAQEAGLHGGVQLAPGSTGLPPVTPHLDPRVVADRLEHATRNLHGGQLRDRGLIGGASRAARQGLKGGFAGMIGSLGAGALNRYVNGAPE